MDHFRTENLWKWTFLSMVHPRDWRRRPPPQIHLRQHHPMLLSSTPSLQIAAGKAIAAEK